MIFGKSFIEQKQMRVVFAWWPMQLDNKQYAWLENVYFHPETGSYSKKKQKAANANITGG